MVKSKDEVTSVDELDDIDIFEELESKDAEGDELPQSIVETADDEGAEIPAIEEKDDEAFEDFEEGNVSLGGDVESEDDAEYMSDEEPKAKGLARELVNLAPDVPVNLAAVIGKTTMSLAELMKYRVGETIDLGRPPNETVDLVANGKLIARGELVEIDGKLGVKICKMVR
jgi:flagellar motor switch protein FliN/FliY